MVQRSVVQGFSTSTTTHAQVSRFCYLTILFLQNPPHILPPQNDDVGAATDDDVTVKQRLIIHTSKVLNFYISTDWSSLKWTFNLLNTLPYFIGWYPTFPRLRTFQFTDSYSQGVAAGFSVAAGNPGGFDATDLTDKKIGFVRGFFTDSSCVARQGDAVTVRILS